MAAPRRVPYQRFDSPEPPPGSFAELFLPPLSVDIGDCKVTSKKDGRFDKHGQLLFSVVFISRGAVLQVVDKKYSELAAFSRTIFERRLVSASERALFPTIPLPEAAADALAAAAASTIDSDDQPSTPVAAAPVPHQRRASLLAQFGAAVGSPATLRLASAVAAATEAVGGDHGTSSSSSSSSNGNNFSGGGYGSGRSHAGDNLELPDGEMTAEDDARAVGVVVAGLKKWLNAVWAAQPTFHRLAATREFFGLCDAVVSLPVRPRLWSAAAPPFLAHYKYPIRMAPQAASGGPEFNDHDDDDDAHDEEEGALTSEVSPEEARALDDSNSSLPRDASSGSTPGNNGVVPLPNIENQSSGDSVTSSSSINSRRRSSRRRSSGANGEGGGWRSLKGRLFGGIEGEATSGRTEDDAEEAWASLQRRGLVPINTSSSKNGLDNGSTTYSGVGTSSSNHNHMPQVELMVTFQENELGLTVVNSDEQRDDKGLACGGVYVARTEGQALRLGVRPGDRILAYNGKPLRPGLRHPEFMQKLARKGCPLVLALMRQTNNSLTSENNTCGSTNSNAIRSTADIRRSSRKTSGDSTSATGATDSSTKDRNDINLCGGAPNLGAEDDEDALFEALFFKRLAELARQEGNARAARAAIREAQVAKERERRWEEEAAKAKKEQEAADSSADAHVADALVGNAGKDNQVGAEDSRSNDSNRNDSNAANDNSGGIKDGMSNEKGLDGSVNSISSNSSISGGVLDALSSVSQGLDLLRSSSLGRVEPFRLGAAFGLESSGGSGLQNVSSSELSHVLASLSESDEEEENENKDEKRANGIATNNANDEGSAKKSYDDDDDKREEVKRDEVMAPQPPPSLPVPPPEPLPDACVLHVSGLPYCAIAEVWENQRYSAVNKRTPWGGQTGVGGHFLLGDRAPFSDDAGRARVKVRLPPVVQATETRSNKSNKGGLRRDSRRETGNSSIICSSTVSEIDHGLGVPAKDAAAAHNPLLGGAENSDEDTNGATTAATADVNYIEHTVTPAAAPSSAAADPATGMSNSAPASAVAVDKAPAYVGTGDASEFCTPEHATAAGLHASVAPPPGYTWGSASLNAGGHWRIDRCHTATDADGFSYAVDFWALAPLARRGASLTYDGSGCFVRRRRWCRALHVGPVSSLSSGRTNAPTPALSRLAALTSSYSSTTSNTNNGSSTDDTTSTNGDVDKAALLSDSDVASKLDQDRLAAIASARGACSRRLLTLCLSRVQHRVAFLHEPAYGFPESHEGGTGAAATGTMASNNGSQDRIQGHLHNQRNYTTSSSSSSHSKLDTSSTGPHNSSCGEWGFGIGPAPLLLAGRNESARGGAMEAAATRSFAALCGFLEGVGFDALWSGGAIAVLVAQRQAARQLAKSLLRAGWPAAAYVRGPRHKQSLVDDTHAVNGPRVLVTTDLDLLTDLNAAVATSAMQSLSPPSANNAATSSISAATSTAANTTAASAADCDASTSCGHSSSHSSGVPTDDKRSNGSGSDADFNTLVAAAIAECRNSEGACCAAAAERAANALKGWPLNSSSSSSSGGSSSDNHSCGDSRNSSTSATHGSGSSVFGALCPLPVLACVHFDLPPDLGTYLRRAHRLFEPLLNNTSGFANNTSNTSSDTYHTSTRKQSPVSLESWVPLSVCLADPQHDAHLLPHLAALVADAGQLTDNPAHLATFLLDHAHEGTTSSSTTSGEPSINSAVAGRSSRSSSNSSPGSSSSSSNHAIGGGATEPRPPVDGSVVRTGLDGPGLAMGMATSIAAAFGASDGSNHRSFSNVNTSGGGVSRDSSSQDVVSSTGNGIVNPFSSFAESVGKALADHFPPTDATADVGDDGGVVFREPAPKSGMKLPSWPNRSSANGAAAAASAFAGDDEGDASELMEGGASWQPSNIDNHGGLSSNSSGSGGDDGLGSDTSAFASAFGSTSISSSTGSSGNYISSSSSSSAGTGRSAHEMAPAELAEQASVGGVAHVDLAGLAHAAGTMTTTLSPGHDSAGSLAAAAAAMNSTATAAAAGVMMPPSTSALLHQAGSGWSSSNGHGEQDEDDAGHDGEDGSFLDSSLHPGSAMDFSWHASALPLEGGEDEEGDFGWEPARISGEDF